MAFVFPFKTDDHQHLSLDTLFSETLILRELGRYESAVVTFRKACDPGMDATITSRKVGVLFVLHTSVWSVLLWRTMPSALNESPEAWDYCSHPDIVVLDSHATLFKDLSRRA